MDLIRSVSLAVVMAIFAEQIAADLNDRPVIGVLSQHDSEIDPHTMYIAASYVKFVESAGARVVPVMTNLTGDEYTTLFGKLNGLLLPGGGVSVTGTTSGYARAAHVFFKLAVEAFDKGEVFAMWGTCLGVQALAVMGAKEDVLVRINGTEDVNLPLNFTVHAADSRLYGSMPPSLMEALSTKRLTYNHHQFGATAHTFATNANLAAMYNVLSTNTGSNGLEFVSTIEGKTLPFFGTQWHSEKNGFEWNTDEHISHDPDSVRVMHHIADVFVSAAQKSTHRFSTDSDLVSHLIYNFSPIYTGRHGSHFEQTYAWPITGDKIDIDKFVQNLNKIKYE
eukprot:scpid55287/ scgid10315/ Gamma-glutamyl hydrolase; Conjugase; GH; Gamma-Glu-X carboxypeptidase